jgi:hypothetical protein
MEWTVLTVRRLLSTVTREDVDFLIGVLDAAFAEI